MKCDEIFAALALLEKERNIPQDFMMDKIVQALTTAYKRDHEGVEYVYVDVNEEKKDLKMYVQKEVVEEVENPASQISLADARGHPGGPPQRQLLPAHRQRRRGHGGPAHRRRAGERRGAERGRPCEGLCGGGPPLHPGAPGADLPHPPRPCHATL